jgi:hypothetical protein
MARSETYAPTLLQRKAARLRKETGNMELRTEYDTPGRKLSSILGVALLRPFRLLATQPIIQVISSKSLGWCWLCSFTDISSLYRLQLWLDVPNAYKFSNLVDSPVWRKHLNWEFTLHRAWPRLLSWISDHRTSERPDL